MKRLKFSVLLGSILVVSLLSTNVLAVSEINQKSLKEKVIFQKSEIKDLSELENLAKQGITDDPDFTIKSQNVTSNNQLSNTQSVDESRLATSQKIKETQFEDGSVLTEFVGNAIVTSYTPVFEDSSSTKRDDATGKIQYKLRVCYYRYNTGSYNRYNVTSIQGTILSIGSNVKINKKTLKYDFAGRCYNSTGSTSYGAKYEHSSESYTTDLGVNITHTIQSPTTYYYEVTGVDHVATRCELSLTNLSNSTNYIDNVDVVFGNWLSW